MLRISDLTSITKRNSVFFIAVSVILMSSFLILSTAELALGDSIVSTLNVGRSPNAIAFNPKNGDMYVANERGGGVSVIDSVNNVVLKNIAMPRSTVCSGTGISSIPHAIAFNPKNGDVYVVGGGCPDVVAVIDSANNTIVKAIDLSNSCQVCAPSLVNSIAFNPKNGDVYVVGATIDPNDGNCLRNVTIACEVSVIDSANNTIVKNIQVRKGPIEIAFNPKNGDMYVANERGRSVSVIDSANNTLIKNVILPGPSSAIAFNPKNGDMYVAGGFSNVISVIDSANNTIVKHIPRIGKGPNAIAFNPKNGDMYVAGGFSKSIFVIDSANNNVIKNIPLENIPNAIAFNPKNGDMYVTVGFSDIVSVIDSANNNVIKNIPVREGALKIASNPMNDDMYVTNNVNNTVSVIKTTSSS